MFKTTLLKRVHGIPPLFRDMLPTLRYRPPDTKDWHLNQQLTWFQPVGDYPQGEDESQFGIKSPAAICNHMSKSNLSAC
jgi:hypothetical protein